MHSIKNEIKIKLKNKYGDITHPLAYPDYMDQELSLLDITNITYSVPNLEKDVTVTFDYNGNCVLLLLKKIHLKFVIIKIARKILKLMILKEENHIQTW